MEELVKKLFCKYDIFITDEQIEKFDLYYKLLIQWNKNMNLTTITDYDDVIKKHFLDSCLLLKVFPVSEFNNKKIIDVGTGAGFPGIPLAIMLQDTEFVLLDSLNKRIDFLTETVKKLNLKNVSLIHGRAEDLGRDNGYREQFDVCVSRAVAALPLLLEYCSPFIKKGGLLYFYKSIKAIQEIQDSENALQLLNCVIQNNQKVVDEKDYLRYLIEIEKVDFTPDKYPRKAGKPKKKPL